MKALVKAAVIGLGLAASGIVSATVIDWNPKGDYCTLLKADMDAAYSRYQTCDAAGNQACAAFHYRQFSQLQSEYNLKCTLPTGGQDS